MSDPIAGKDAPPDPSFFISGVRHLSPQLLIFLSDSVPNEFKFPHMVRLMPVLHLGMRCVIFYPWSEFESKIEDPTTLAKISHYVRSKVNLM